MREGRPVAESEGTPAPCCRPRLLVLVKRGNAPSEWEDAWDAGTGVVAVCDGASEGIFARQWAQLLARTFVEDIPDLEQDSSLSEWLDRGCAAWQRQINYPALRWSQQRKVDRTGAAATLVALRLREIAEDGLRDWRAWAIGDSCLFWVRGNHLLTSFPIKHSVQFALGPPLLRTKVEGMPPRPLVASGRCLPDDLFVLATDAIAQRLLREQEQGTPPDWDQMEWIDEECWRARIESLRDAGEIVNDDCTLLFLRVSPVG